MPSSLSIALYVSAALSLAFGGATLAAASAAPAKKLAAPVVRASAWTVDKAFAKWDAQINFDPKSLATSKAVVSIDLASVASGDADRDETLPSADWFNVARFPKAVFTTTAITDAGGGKYNAAGTLSLRGVTKPVVLPFTLTITGDTAKMSGQVVLNRSQFGVGQGQFTAPDAVPFEVAVPVTVVARRAG